jgi:hypothetical protein
MSQQKIYYEVYDNRAVLFGIEGLVLLDRQTQLRKATRSAKAWAGCVVKVKREVDDNGKPGRVLEAKLQYVYRRRVPPDPTGGLTLRQLRRVLTTYDGKLNRYKRRRE